MLRIALVVAMVAWLAPRADARTGAIIYEFPILPSQLFDPSIEAAGMGGASIAAFWQENPNDHGNPALMGFHTGLRYSYGTTKLLPEFSDDLKYTSHRILAGAWGVGVAMTGKPVESIGRLRLDYGPSEITDVNGNVLGVFDAHEDTRSFAVGLSVFDLISSIRVAKGGEPLSFGHRLSLAVGHAWKSYEADLAPASLVPNGHGEGNNNDAGILLRVAPFDQIGGTLREANGGTRWKVDIAGAYTRINYLNDHNIDYGSGQTDEIFGHRSYGGSALFTVALPNDGVGDLWDFATPAIRLGVVYEHTELYEGDTNLGNLGNSYGAELSVIDMLYLRYGRVDGDALGSDDDTFGAGIALKYRNMIGVRGDYAAYPRGSFLASNYDRYGITFFVDPYRLMKKRAD
jgi:hypothetical protein